jgi:hypothetical protein
VVAIREGFPAGSCDVLICNLNVIEPGEVCIENHALTADHEDGYGGLGHDRAWERGQENGAKTSPTVEFVSEYRGFVLDGEILGIRHYEGDFRVFPDVRVIDAAVATYSPSPSAYGIDFGIASEGQTLFFETNEVYSLGCYGLTPILYSSLLERRWNELTCRTRHATT